MKLKICLLGLLCLFFEAKSQTKPTTKFLEVGDKMPDVQISNIMNWKSKTAKISDFKGKMIILDFWNSFCGGCIAGFPKLDSLQRQFKGKLQVFLVNPDNNQETERSMNIVIDRMNSWFARSFTLPIVYRDKALSENFSFYGVPYAVWIGPEGTIVAIPDESELTAENIAKVLAGEKVTLKHRVERNRSIQRKVTI
ncbi:TlpA family protein disulfide reductase [Mucilaginibacter angelicae]|uniref:TlpA family protein disulfide reductase n=1 Tax=Mucilaginibacter angelicae TaxID=869718 RepID=A0ABV6L063_9SPHI